MKRNTKGLLPGGHGKCNRTSFAKKIRAVRRLRPSAEFKPLFRHLLSLAIYDVKIGYCDRAGREVAYARKLAEKYPG